MKTNKPFHEGDKVVFMEDAVNKVSLNWSGNTDPRGVLEDGEVYTVGDVDVHSYHTKVELDEVDGKFNSVWFDVVERNTIMEDF